MNAGGAENPGVGRPSAQRLYWLAALLLPVMAVALRFSGLRYSEPASYALLGLPFLLVFIGIPFLGYLAIVFIFYSNADSLLPYAVFAPILALTLYGLAVRKLLTGDRLALPRWYTWGVLVFLLLAAQSLVVAVDPARGLVRWKAMFTLFLVLYAAFQVIRDRRSFERVLWVVVLGSLITVVIGFRELTANLEESDLAMTYMEETQTVRFSGLLGDANYYAMVLVGILPITWALLYRVRNAAARLFLIAVGVALVTASALSFSRGGFLALAVVAVAALWEERRRRWVPLAVAVGVIAVLMFFPAQYWNRVATLVEAVRGGGAGGDHSFMLRLRSVETSLALIARYPFTGVGLDQFLAHAVRLDYAPYALNVHNMFLEVLSHMGLPGFAAFLFLMMKAWRSVGTGIDSARARGDGAWASTLAYLRIGFLGTLTGKMFLTGYVDFPLWHPLVLMVIAAGLPLSGPRGEQGVEADPRPS
jgi:putative inorganic carbon (HCO3(-)) transporter